MPADPKTVDLIYIFTALLVPIVPAAIFFRWFDSVADVSTPPTSKLSAFLQGLGVKLGGAFGGYFLVMYIILRCRPPIPVPVPPGDEVWTLTGNFQSSPPIASNTEISIQYSPDPFNVPPDNTFKGQFLVQRIDAKLVFPTVTFARLPREKFQTATVHLEDPEGDAKIIGKVYRTRRDDSTRQIDIVDPIELLPVSSPYVDTGTPLPSPPQNP